MTRHAIAALAIISMAVVLFATAPTGGDFWWYDSSRHAMNGVFMRDALTDGGLWSPKAFATAYYRRWPAINVGFYPPLFYVVSVPFLLLLGVSHAVSQLVVTVHAAAAAWFVYLLCVERLGRIGAVATAVVALCVPGAALWARQVQLDIPAVAWLLGFAYVFVRHLRSGSGHLLFLSAVVLGCAALTRVQSLCVLPAFVLILMCYRYPGRPSLAIRCAAIGIAALVAAPGAAMLFYFPRETTALAAATPGMPALTSPSNWFWYVRQLPDQLGIGATIAVVVGLALGSWRWRELARLPEVKVLSAMLALAWLFFTLVSNKDPRFNLPSIAPLVMLAALGFGTVRREVAAGVMGTLAIWLVVSVAWRTPVPFVGGFHEAAVAARGLASQGSNILVSAHRDGTFIYDLRALGRDGDVGVRRADKLLVDISIMRELGVRDPELNEERLLALLAREKIDTIVWQSGYLDDLPTMSVLGSLLRAGAEFDERTRIPMTGLTNPTERELVIYTRHKR